MPYCCSELHSDIAFGISDGKRIRVQRAVLTSLTHQDERGHSD